MADVPAFYQSYVAALVEQSGAFPYTVLTPTYAGFLVRATEKLLCTTPDAVHCLERLGEEPSVTVFHFDAINYVEIGCILLNSWIKINGRDDSGAYSTVKVKFNTVTDYLFTPVVESIRCRHDQGLRADMSVERAKFDYLALSHFKFMNAARRSLLAGESVRESLMQPEMRSKIITVFGRSLYRMKAPAHIMILTDAELIIVSDEDRDSWGGEVKHGSIRTCIPLAKIVHVDCAVQQDDLVLTITLPGDEMLAFSFAGTQQHAVEQLAAHMAATPAFA
jgi:hypothetical protein